MCHITFSLIRITHVLTYHNQDIPHEEFIMTTLILGATGTVGSLLVDRLAAQGHKVRAATRHPEAHSHAQDNVSYVAFDYADTSAQAEALRGVTRLFILSSSGYADTYTMLLPFLEQVRATDSIERIVTMTALGVDVDPSIPLRKIELEVESMGKPFVHLRPNWFAQNFHTYWGYGITHHDSIELPAADSRVAFIDTRDIADAAAAALTREDIELHRAYELTGPSALTHEEAATVLSHTLGRRITYKHVNDKVLEDVLTGVGFQADYIAMMLGLFAAMRMGAASAVSTHVKTLTGHEPRPLADYVRDYAEALAHV